MGKKLAIRGHPTRGNEVIKLLKMMGAVYCPSEIYAVCENRCYLIKDNSWIGWDYICPEEIDKYNIFTLEEFLEKYPFKVGDKVEVCESHKVFTIGNMIWEDELCTVHYANMEDFEYYTANELKLYKETNMNENKFGTAVNPAESKSNTFGLKDDKININDDAIFSFNYTMRPEVNADGMLCYKIPDGYESFSIQDGTIILKPIKPKYPTTYEECCMVLQDACMTHKGEYKGNLIQTFQKLVICRDAYWKIAGKEMGLGKSWKPDWKNTKNVKYGITLHDDIITKMYLRNENAILAFPTEEMRDAFYENFNNEIESCKELL